MTPSLAPAGASAMRPASAGGEIVLRVYDEEGNRLDWNGFRALADGGRTGNGIDDALLDATSLTMTAQAPLFSSNGQGTGDPALRTAGSNAALSVAWPTSAGYSNLIVGLPGKSGTYDFDALAAQQVLSDIAASLARRGGYTPSARFEHLYAMAKSDYASGRRAKIGSQRGALDARAIDRGVSAEMLLLAQSGAAYARTHENSFEWGGTFDTITGGTDDLRTLAGLYPTNGWLRICFDPGEKPAYYAGEIKDAHALGLRVVGQILDSSEMRRWSVAAFERRTREYVGALPDVDEWEAGNEVNGSWLGSIQSVVAKTAYAAAYVKRHTHARVLVTLYWELGNGRPANAIFNWAAANLGSFEKNVDDIGVSLYPRQNPMGEPFDRVIGALHATFPQQRIMLTELDYDGGPGWWWGSPDAIAPEGRDAVAKTYQSAIMGYPYSGGGTFWWYFVEEVSPGNPLYRTLANVYRAAH